MIFDSGTASANLDDYRRSGPAPMTARLLAILKAAGVTGLSLLDIGGGVGVIQHELAGAGVSGITDVDASRAYLSAARSEATRRGYAVMRRICSVTSSRWPIRSAKPTSSRWIA